MHLWYGIGRILEIPGEVGPGDDARDGGEEDAEHLQEVGLLVRVRVHGAHPVI